MVFLIYGALGVLTVLLLFFGGAFLGWHLHTRYLAHNHKIIREELTDEQKRKFAADQAAWDAMMNYSVETAYGLNPTLEEIAKKE